MRIYTLISMFSLTLLSATLSVSVSALPSAPPPGGYTGGVFAHYFQNIIEGDGSIGTTSAGACTIGKAITGFSVAPGTYGLPICGTVASPQYWTSTDAGANIYFTGAGNVAIGKAVGAAKLDVTGDILVNGVTVGRGGGNLTSNITLGNQAFNSNTVGGYNTAIGSESLRVNTTGNYNTAIGWDSIYNANADYNTAIGPMSLMNNVSGGMNTAIGVLSLGNTNGAQNVAIGHMAGQNLISGNNNIAIGFNTSFPSTTGSNQLNIGNWIYGQGGNIGIGTGTALTAKLTVAGQISGGFGAQTTAGVLDWNDITNARSGNGNTLLLGGATNGPIIAGGMYYHPFSFEYSSKNGGGNMTQLAVPYNDGALNAGMYMRTRYSGTWGNWARILSENTAGNVGIGTTTPGAKLEVAGTVKITGGAPGVGKVLTSDATGLASWATPSGAAISGGQTNYIARWITASTLGTGSIFDNGTNVGIGTTTPSAKLAVNAIGVIGGANQGAYDIGAGRIAVGQSLYSYGRICAGAASGDCTGGGGFMVDTAGTLTTAGVVNVGTTSSNLFMNDTDESTTGPKRIHANSNLMGFLNGAGSWMSYWDNAGNQQNTGNITAGNLVNVVNTFGNVNIGPQNSSFMHFTSDRPAFYMNKALHVDGIISKYGVANQWADVNANSYMANNSIYSYGRICAGMSSGDCTGVNGFLADSAGNMTANGIARVGTTSSNLFMNDSDESTSGPKRIHANSNLIGFINGAGSWMSYWDNAGNQSTPGAITVQGGIADSAGTRMDAAGGWLRTYGNSGWYNGTYAGGMYMIDSTWIRTYAGKYFYVDSIIQAGAYMNSPAYYYISDARLKKDLKKIDSPLAKIEQMNGYYFNWKKDDKKDIGLIAQEVEKIFPDAVGEYTDPDSKEKYKNVEYGHLIAPVIEAIKELAGNVKSNTAEIDALKTENAELKKRLDAIEARLAK